MAAPPKITTPAQVLKITFGHTLGTGKTVGTSMYFVYTGGRPAVADCTALATDAATAWNANLAGLFTHDGILEQVTCQDIYDTSGHESVVAVSHAGTRGGDQPWVGACAVINYKIARHFRGGKAKGFWPFGIVSDLTVGNSWAGAFITACNTGAANFVSAFNSSSSGTTVVDHHTAVSFFSGSQANPDSSIWAPRNSPKPRGNSLQDAVIAYSTQTDVGSQRRRRS